MPIRLRGARAHNLAGLDLDLTPGTWIAVTGPSGSGKSSLVGDTLVGEGQRRYLSALSARARQYLGKLGHPPVDTLDGLPVPVAVGGAGRTGHSRSTVGTRTGALDGLRLWFAREAHADAPLMRSHFSFNHPDGACLACQGLGVQDHVDPALLVADPARTLRGGALVPTLKSGYTVYSQVTVDVMDELCRAHGFDVDTPWGDLTDAQRDVVMYGTTALVVPFGKHPLENRLKWEGITARPRQQGHYRGLIPVITDTLKRNRNPNVLRFVRTVPCDACGGSRLGSLGRTARLHDTTLPELVRRPARQLVAWSPPASPVADVVWPSVHARLQRMVQLGLGHLALDRGTRTLSGGEAQRLDLVSQLTTGLSEVLYALDEPTLGLHPSEQPGMIAVLDDLRAQGNTVLVVEHDPDLVRAADRVIALGPGAGPDGGRLVSDGPPDGDPLGPAPAPKASRRPGTGTLTLRGASLHTLDHVDLAVRLGTLNVVTGPSGAGKSSLVLHTLVPALTRRPGGPFTSLEGVPEGLAVHAVDASPIGRTPRSTPATWTGWFDAVRKAFAATPAAKAAGFAAGRFSYNDKAGRCPTCEGLGVQRIGLHLVSDVELACPACGGGRYAPETLQVRWRGRTVAEVLSLTVSEALDAFGDDARLAPVLRALDDLGLGYVRLGQSSTTLSRGEAQRVKLATRLAAPTGQGTLVVLDEPDRGLHPTDVVRLLRCLEALVDAGHTVLAISHHRHLWAAADHRVALADGRLVAPRAHLPTRPRSPAPPAQPPPLTLRGVRTHNLQRVDVTLPRHRLTAVIGVSGSGKSSLAFDTLAAEAWHRFGESLPFEVRRHVRRLPRPVLDAATGLAPPVVLRQQPGRGSPRSTIATQTGLGLALRLLWSRRGTPAGRSAAELSPHDPRGACPACAGRGQVARCDPDRLVTDPDQPLAAGALAGTKPGRFFGEPDGQHLATLAALADITLPWSALPEATRQLALYGAGDTVVSVTWRFQRGKRTGEHALEGTWPGLCALVEREARLRSRRADAAAWAVPLVDRPCDACGGARLGEAARAVTLAGRSLPEVLALPLAEVAAALPDDPVVGALRIREGVAELVDLGLGHLSLDRRTASLSSGEQQRVRLGGLLRSGLSGLLIVLDEPDASLHPDEVDALGDRLLALCAAGNTAVVVTHRPALMRRAHHVIELGPGAGADGGRVVGSGPPDRVLSGDGPTATALAAAAPRARPHTPPALWLRGVEAGPLRGLDLALPASGVVAVVGPSGTGKSTLLFDVLSPSARARAPVGCRAVEGLDRFVEVRSARDPVRARSVLGVLGALPALQGLYAAAGDLPKRAFSFLGPAGRCETCKGSGTERVSMDAFADLDLPCAACGGRRYRPEVLAVRWQGRDVAGLLAEPVDRLPELPGRLGRATAALDAVGLGHLSLGRRPATLSGGERQRLGLAAAWLDARHPALILLDGPGAGLHPHDLAVLLAALRTLADRGDLVVAAIHRHALAQAADQVIDLPRPAPGP